MATTSTAGTSLSFLLIAVLDMLSLATRAVIASALAYSLVRLTYRSDGYDLAMKDPLGKPITDTSNFMEV